MERKKLKVKDLRELLSDAHISDEDYVTIVLNGEGKSAICMEYNEFAGELVIEDESIIDTVFPFTDNDVELGD